MSKASRSLEHELLPAIVAGVWATALFAVGVVLATIYAAPIQDAVTAHGALGVLVFFVTSIVAVLMPLLSNLLLVPFAVLAWGPWWTAGLLLSGWIAGAGLSFALGRHARDFVLRHFPAVQRYGDIDRLIDPRHRLASLVLLRMTFPVDVLSYSLGMFSRSTTLTENVVSTAVGAAPFAVLFALFPTLSTAGQAAVIGGSVLAFVAYVPWVLRRSSGTTRDG
jgi:uncharacterized membrane protein YdjX (TVP38/TMEM64 family)